MDPRFQTSFIPKRPIIDDNRIAKSHTIDLFMIIASTLFIFSIALSGGVFGYKKIVLGQIEESKAMLIKNQNAFDPGLIKEIVRLDDRINTAGRLLDKHVNVSSIFDVLERDTLQTVRFQSFTFDFISKDKVTLDMVGEANGFASVALQSDKFNENNNFKNTIISGLRLEPLGTVSFKVTTSIEPSLILYKELFKNKSVSEDMNTTENISEENFDAVNNNNFPSEVENNIILDKSQESGDTTISSSTIQ